MVFKVIPERVAQRALHAFTLDPDTFCHVSTYSVASHGYAQIGWYLAPGKTTGTTAHRAAWTAVHGQIPDGMDVDHWRCGNSRCVNVRHLRLLSMSDNARRNKGDDWPLGECRNGHPESARRRYGNRTRCSFCFNAAQRKYRKNKRAGKK